MSFIFSTFLSQWGHKYFCIPRGKQLGFFASICAVLPQINFVLNIIPRPKVSFSKLNQASVFTSIFPSAIFKVPPKFPHFLHFIAKYSILGAQCYSSGKSYSWSLKFSMIGGIHQRFFFISLLKNPEFQSSLSHHSSYTIRLTSSFWY